MSADELLQALLGDDASLILLKQLLIERTAGNPFFLEESVRTLVETGVLVGERGAYRLGQSLTAIQVPATVQTVLAARSIGCHWKKNACSRPRPLLAMKSLYRSYGPLLSCRRRLCTTTWPLQAAEFLDETHLFPEREYTFKHALTHEVAYGSLSRSGGGRCTRASCGLEELYADRLTEQVDR